MFDHPLSLQGVYSSILYVNFQSKMQKKVVCPLAKKISTASLKNSIDASARLQLYTCGANNHDNINNHH